MTLHTHPPGDPCPAHLPVDDGTSDRAMSKCADVVSCREKDWPRGRRVDSRTTHAAMNSKSQASCLLCDTFSAQVHSQYTPKGCTMCDEMHLELLWCENCSRCACIECCRQEAFEADYNNRNAEESESGSVGSAVFCLDCGLTAACFLPLVHQTQCSECDSGFSGNDLVRVLSHLHLPRMLGQWRAGCFGKIPTHPRSADGGWCGEGEVGGENEHPPTSLLGVLR